MRLEGLYYYVFVKVELRIVTSLCPYMKGTRNNLMTLRGLRSCMLFSTMGVLQLCRMSPCILLECTVFFLVGEQLFAGTSYSSQF
jgi:hypothetical protein